MMLTCFLLGVTAMACIGESPLNLSIKFWLLPQISEICRGLMISVY
jgi:hypothetical protein